MGLSYKIGNILPLLHDEKVLHAQEDFRAMTMKCFPSCSYAERFMLAVTSLRITNKRCLADISGPFRYNLQEIDLWFPGIAPNGQTELIMDVSIQQGFLGKYLQVKSTDPSRTSRWYLSPDLTVKFYCDNAEELQRIITEAMN